MKRLLILQIIIGLAVCGSLRAEIPLVLEETIQLPTSGAWDMQHWMSDSTYGWACISGDTILYVEALGDEVQRYVVPLDSFGFALMGHERVTLLRLSRDLTHAFALVQSRAGIPDYEQQWRMDVLYVTLFDLTAGQRLGSFEMTGSESANYGMSGYSYSRAINALQPWPPPPEASHDLITVWLSNEENDESNSSGYVTQTNAYGAIFYSNLDSGTFGATTLAAGTKASIFAGVGSLRFALTGARWYDYYNSQGGSNHWDSCWVNRYDRRTGFGNADYSGCYLSAVAQRDFSGTERMIVCNALTAKALDPVTYSLLWQDSIPYGVVPYAARLRGSGDERLLTLNTQTRRFSVFEADSGVFLDSTSQITGTMQYLIKYSQATAEFVTCESASHTVRVYGPDYSTPPLLTCTYDPDVNVVHLTWEEFPNAVEYYVYSSPNASTVETLEAIVPASTNTLDLTPQDLRRFYFVTAEYTSR